jgi:hypothetical protein
MAGAGVGDAVGVATGGGEGVGVAAALVGPALGVMDSEAAVADGAAESEPPGETPAEPLDAGAIEADGDAGAVWLPQAPRSNRLARSVAARACFMPHLPGSG